MCLIIHATNRNAIHAIPAAILTQAWKGNSDGAGIAYRVEREGKVHVLKGMMELSAFLDVWDRLLGKTAIVEVAIHVRFSTGGLTNAANTHPFLMRHGALIHNGRLGINGTKTESDTARFARLAHKMPMADVAELLESSEILSGSRVLLLPHGKKAIKLGEWHRGIVRGLYLSQTYSAPQLVRPRPVVVRSTQYQRTPWSDAEIVRMNTPPDESMRKNAYIDPDYDAWLAHLDAPST